MDQHIEIRGSTDCGYNFYAPLDSTIKIGKNVWSTYPSEGVRVRIDQSFHTDDERWIDFVTIDGHETIIKLRLKEKSNGLPYAGSLVVDSQNFIFNCDP